jgi:hypothetical protein
MAVVRRTFEFPGANDPFTVFQPSLIPLLFVPPCGFLFSWETRVWDIGDHLQQRIIRSGLFSGPTHGDRNTSANDPHVACAHNHSVHAP